MTAPSSPHSPYKSRGGVRRIVNALLYSMQGLNAAIRHEAAFRQELALAIVLIPAAFFLGRSMAEIFLLIGVILLVLVVELLNSAIEAVADAVSTEHHPLIGRAKDMGSAAVLICLIFTAIVWFTVLYMHFYP